MKIFIYISAFLVTNAINAQSAFHNFGEMKMHTNSKVGFHTDFINDGILDNNNQGTTGFYSDNEIRSISGNNRAIFNNIEIDVVNDIELYTSIGIENDLNFISGKVFTPRNGTNVSLDYINHNIYAGEGNLTHVDGYTSVIGSSQFSFPVGDDNRIRPMVITTASLDTEFIGAYYFINPNTPPSHFTQAFTTSEKHASINNVSTYEFWNLHGTGQTTVNLTWDNNSGLTTIVDDINNLIVVGWSKQHNKWINLGNSAIYGNITTGSITSSQFTPNDYEIITIGSKHSDTSLTNVNLIFTPNGDEHNNTLTFDNLDDYENNRLTVYNRWGNVVYNIENYQNDWKGNSNGRATLSKDEDLPEGTYFYTLELGNNGKLTKNNKGWIYIHR